ncbi:SAM-dependent methyltransferase [Caenimonas aquaedulcis]|uniref:SAM-dependent methyltransferase n=1 Tax=Caenimonas aquaedulcis TaxID=2793270 RepID=A0A931H3L1_9BURK|nr:SAM-dependent methyltransferase [Caenimonas aquaedulcis]MBG9387897.1 SAM-dependent methyltransferase [Caenimonas aquaedulcis]
MHDTGKGALYLVPAPLDFGCAVQAPLADVMPQATLLQASALSHWICENAKSARAYLNRIAELHPLSLPLREQQIVELPREVHKKGDHAVAFDARPMLTAALSGHDIGLLSEAGMPAIADPGSSVVRAAHDLGLRVAPLVGPVSLLLLLAASGMNGQNFAFVGYLPQDSIQRAQRLRELENLVQKTGQTQLFIETPYRNAAIWDALVKSLQPGTRLAAGSSLTMPDAQVRSLSIAQWRHEASPVSNDTPAVFAIGR